MSWYERRTGLSAGGYNNFVAFNPNLPGHIIACGDTFGMNESFDGGDTWWPANWGLYDEPPGFACVMFDPNSTYIFAPQGTVNSPVTKLWRGVVVTEGSEKFTRWTRMGQVTGITWGGGDLPYLPAGDVRPRAAGRVMAIQTVSGVRYVYHATHDKGIHRSSNDFVTTTRIATEAMVGTRVHSIMLDPTNNNRMLVGRWDYGSGDQGALLLGSVRTAADSSGVSVTVLTNAPPTVLEWCVIGTNVYAACGWYGVYRVSGANWQTWTPINDGLPTATPGASDQPYVTGIDGFNDGTNDVLFISYTNPVKLLSGDGNWTTVCRMVGAQAGAPTWESLTRLAANIDNRVYTSGEKWWVLDSFPSFALGKPTGDAEAVASNPHNRNVTHVVGRAGGWQSRNALASAGTVVWRPSVYGQGGTTPRMLLTDPNRSGYVYQMNTDHCVVASANDMQPGYVKKIIPAGAGNQGTWGDVGPDGKLYVCTGIRHGWGESPGDPGKGEIYRYEGDPLTSSTTSLLLKDFTGANQNKPAGIAVTGTASVPIAVAGVIGIGVCRKVGNGSWQVVVPNTVFSVTRANTDLFPTAKDINGQAVFILDQRIGLFRSLDQGATWPNHQGTSPRVWWPGTAISVGCDPFTSGRVYLCRAGGIWRVDGATTISTDPDQVAVRITPSTGELTSLEGMAVDRVRGYLYAVTRSTATQDPALYECQNPGAGTPTWTKITGTRFAAMGYSMNWVAVDNPGGQVFVMPSSVFIVEQAGIPGGGGAVGPLVGGSGLLVVR